MRKRGARLVNQEEEQRGETMNNFLTTEQVKLSWSKEGWIVGRWVESPVDENLMIDIKLHDQDLIAKDCLKAGDVTWTTDLMTFTVIAYRLTNNKYFKDGIYNGYADETDESSKHYDNWAAQKNPLTYSEALEEQKKHDGIAIEPCKITQMKEQKAAEWDGEALPPAGTVCEIAPIKSDIWTEYKIIAYYGIHAWIVEAGCLDPGTCLVGGCKFRPIKSQRDKVIEAAISKFGAFGSASGYDEVYGEMYDAGFLTLPEGDK